MNPDDYDPTTSVECPVRRCESGYVVTREEHPNGTYSITSDRCEYCLGTGAVSPAKFARYTGKRKT